MKKILMLHGVNHNMFGKRDPVQYGTITLAEIDEKMRALGKELGVEVTSFQTNDEGAMCDRIHQAFAEKMDVSGDPPTPRVPRPRSRKRRRLRLALLVLIGVPLLAAVAMTSSYYVIFVRIVDARLQGERVRALPRVLARPFEIHRGQWLSAQQLADRLNDLGYAERAAPDQPGEFSRLAATITLVARGGDLVGRRLRVQLAPQPRGLPAAIGTDGKPIRPSTLSRGSRSRAVALSIASSWTGRC